MCWTFVFIVFRITIDYQSLNADYKDLEESDLIKKRADKLNKAIHSLQDTIQRIQAPNMKVSML